ncbi:hypothetical protein [Thaumasiovibrio sp. DFM-14]|uniref:hypothetical protein n=1 Tax=Thaumasiovibrio sp. DFM-14 TaxID=3384792 RepID=UPI0039A2DBD7
MADKENYQVAIDILRCHLGMSEEEAHEELGISNSEQQTQPNIVDTQQALLDVKPAI